MPTSPGASSGTGSDQGLLQTLPDGTRRLAYGGDFGDRPNLKNFCLNGIVSADRGLTPKYHEVQKVYQPIAFAAESVAPEDVRLRITNRHSHVNLSRFDFRWRIECDGQTVQEGSLPEFDAAPGQSTTVPVPVKPIANPVAGADYWLFISAHTKQDQPWAPSGHTVAWEQVRLDVQAPPAPVVSNSRLPAMRVEKSATTLTANGNTFQAVFDRKSGTLQSLVYNSRDVLSQSDALSAGPTLQAFRAPTDNDRGFGKWLASLWKQAGLDRLQRTPVSFRFSQPKRNTLQVSAVEEYKGPTGSIRLASDWTIRGDGSADLRCRFQPAGELPPLPRIGLALRVAPELENLACYAQGPLENYPDRLAAARVGVWTGTVDEQYVPYPKPQETGTRQGVRWLALRDDQGRGVVVVAEEEPFAASALHFIAQDLAAARHADELNPRPEVILSIDAKHCGLGNSSCGPGVLERYAVPAKPYSLHVSLRPLNSGDDPAQVARLRHE